MTTETLEEKSIISLIHQMPLKAREKILPLLSKTIEDKEIDWTLQQIGISVASLFSRSRNFEDAKDLFIRYEYYLDAAKMLKALGRKDEAKQYIKRIFETFYTYRDSSYDKEALLSEAKELLSTNELEDLLVREFDEFTKKHDKTDDSNFQDISKIYRAFVAQQKGQSDKVEEIYRRSKKEMERLNDRLGKLLEKEEKGSKYYEKIENIGYCVDGAEDFHAELCDIIGKKEEAFETCLYSDNHKVIVFNEEFSPIVEKMDKEQLKWIYEDILRQSITWTSPQNYFIGAMAAEKLNLKEDAKEYYESALQQAEERFWLGSAFDIAKKLNRPEKIELYTQIAGYLYTNKFI